MSTESSSASNSNPSTSSQYASYPSSNSYFPLPFHLQNSDPAAAQQQFPNPYMPPPPVRIPTVPQAYTPAYSAAGPVVSGVYSLPQYQQAQQLFQRDAQTITPEALESVKAALASSEIEHKAETKKKAIPRKAAGQAWEDPTLAEWPDNDFRLFCGDLGNEVNDDVLSKAFSRFPSFNMARNSDPAAAQQQFPNPYMPPPPVRIPTVPQAYTPAYSAAGPVVSGVYSLPQYQQAQQLFQRDAQTITPEALESVKAALASSEIEHKAETKKKAIPRKAAGQAWEDPTLAEWPDNDFRLFCGDLGNEVNDDVLSKAFSRFPSFNMARVVRDKRTGKTRGYGFVSFANLSDLAAALKEMNGKYVGNRPIKLRKSNWKDRTDVEALERQKNHTQKKPKLQKKSILHN